MSQDTPREIRVQVKWFVLAMRALGDLSLFIDGIDHQCEYKITDQVREVRQPIKDARAFFYELTDEVQRNGSAVVSL